MSKNSKNLQSISRRKLLSATSKLSILAALLSNSLQAKSLLRVTESTSAQDKVDELINFINSNGLLWVAEHKLLLFEQVLFSHPDAVLNVLKDSSFTDVDISTFNQISALTDRKFKWLERKDTKNETFENWGKSISNTPRETHYITQVAVLKELVQKAKQNNLRIRVAQFRHSFSDIFSENTQLLVCLQSKRLAIGKPSLHPSIDPENEFQQIELIGKPYLTKQRHHLCKVGSAVHNNHIRLWSYEQWQSKQSDPDIDAWGIPYNVVLVENALGSVCCSGCHGAGINTQSLSDLVVAIEFINTNGELQTVCDYEELKLAQYTIPQGWLNDKATLKSIVANFGLIGVVTSLVLRLDELSYALLQPKRVPMLSAIPPKKLDDAPDFFAPQKSSSTDLIKAKDNFIKICENNYYAEFFYFPYQQDAIVNTWDNSGDFNDSIPSPIQAHDLEQNVLTYFVYLITPVLSKLLSQEEVAKLFAELTNKVFYQPDQPVCIPISEAMHFQRGIHNIPVTIMEMNIAIPTMDDGSLDWAVGWDIWWRAMTLIYSQAKGKQALQTTMEVRVTGGSEVALSPLYGSKACFAIEILGNLQVPKQQWIEFMQSVLNQWLSVKDSQGNPIQVRPHWNKQWRELKFNGLSGIDYMASVYSEQTQLFLAGLERIAMEGGYSTEETQQLFSNPTFDNIIFGNS